MTESVTGSRLGLGPRSPSHWVTNSDSDADNESDSWYLIRDGGGRQSDWESESAFKSRFKLYQSCLSESSISGCWPRPASESRPGPARATRHRDGGGDLPMNRTIVIISLSTRRRTTSAPQLSSAVRRWNASAGSRSLWLKSSVEVSVFGNLVAFLRFYSGTWAPLQAEDSWPTVCRRFSVTTQTPPSRTKFRIKREVATGCWKDTDLLVPFYLMAMELEQLHLGGFLDFKTRADAIRPEVGRNESRIPVRVTLLWTNLNLRYQKRSRWRIRLRVPLQRHSFCAWPRAGPP